MKSILFSVVLALCSICTISAQDIRVMSFNLRFAGANDGENIWDNRKEGVLYCLDKEKPDLLGIQEGMKVQIDYLDSNLKEYGREGIGRNGGSADEYSAIYYNTKKFDKIDGGTYWLSETPEQVSMGWDAACTRIITWVKLRDKKSGREFFYLNTHFDHVGKVARANSAEMILSGIQTLCSGYPVIFSGDLNATENDAPIKHLTENKILNDSRKLAKERVGEENTFHGFGNSRGGVIDYIMVTPGIEVKRNEVISYKFKERYLSDHNPVVADITIK